MAEVEQVLRGLCEDLLEKMEVVSEVASKGLKEALPDDANVALAAPGNAMTGDMTATRLYEGRQLLHKNQHRVVNEPFVSRIEVLVEGDTKPQHFYITRGSLPSLALPKGIKLANYNSKLGRLAALDLGDIEEINGLEYEIIGHAFVMPQRKERWDGVVDRVERGSWRGRIGGLRAYLERRPARVASSTAAKPSSLIDEIMAEDARRALEDEQRHRRVVERMSLRDQPTLDKHQDGVFRLPLERQILLLGPPGSGKTTTLVQRLSQKIKPEGLESAESAKLQRLGLGVSMNIQRSWVMFSPTELLQLYLRDAFARENIAAGPDNLRIWERERRVLGREVFRILRSGSTGAGFVLVDNATLRDEQSKALSALHDEFATFYGEALLKDLEERFAALDDVRDAETREVVGKARSLVGGARGLTAQDLAKLLEVSDALSEAQQSLREHADVLVRRAADELVMAHQGVLTDLKIALPKLRAAQEGGLLDDEDEEYERVVRSGDHAEAVKFLFIGLRALARQRDSGARPGREAKVVLEIIAGREPADWSLEELGRVNKSVAALKRLAEAPQRSVMGLARYYRKFREQHLERYVEGLEATQLSGAELDVLLLVALRGARRLFATHPRFLTVEKIPDWLERIKSRYILQVFVDEATDFSAVQLGCMMELCHPQMRSWFACGDLRQRLTAHGLQSIEELEWLNRRTRAMVEPRDISTGYRQTKKLEVFTRALLGEEVASAETDEPPILFEPGLQGAPLVDWLSRRVMEINQALGRLPSIAIFVDGDARIDPLLGQLSPLLRAHSVEVVGCKEGRIVGDAQEVRIFDIKHVKGLEFEAVFFVGVDHLAARLPALCARYLYVGATRAATYLGLTTEGDIPTELLHALAYTMSGDVVWAR
jgi:hypothetical protein